MRAIALVLTIPEVGFSIENACNSPGAKRSHALPGLGSATTGFVVMPVCKLRAYHRLFPWHGFESRNGTKHARSGEERPQPIYKRACLCWRAIDQDQALTIF